jgi:hypothetical protein
VSYTKKELRNYLKDLLKGKIDLGGFTFEYRSGHTAFHSRLRIILASDRITHWKIPKGIPVESSEETKAARIRETEFSIDKLRVFVQELAKSKIWDLKNCTEKALPDTALLSFSIRNNDTLLFEQEVWENCRNDNKQTKELLKVLAAILPQDWPPP